MGGGGQIFKLLAGEDVESDKVNLSVTVLSGLGGGHVDDLARAALDDNVTVLPQCRALHGVGGRGTGIGTLDIIEYLCRENAVNQNYSEMGRKGVDAFACKNEGRGS